MADWREVRRHAASSDAFSELKYETTADGIAVITFNRPEKKNPWGVTMSAEVSRALHQANQDDKVRAVVITGAGKAFCSGLDLSDGPTGHQAVTEFYSTDAHEEDARKDKVEESKEMLPFMLNKPVIAAINGAAVGIGLSYPMVCDVRIVAEDAKLGFLFSRRGLVPELAAHLLVPRICGLSNALDLLMSGRVFDGREAARIGLASAAVPADQVLPLAMERARQFAAAAPGSVAFVKQLTWSAVREPTTMEEIQARESEAFSFLGKQDDFKEGIASFVERRPVQWKLRPSQDLPSNLLDPLGRRPVAKL